MRPREYSLTSVALLLIAGCTVAPAIPGRAMQVGREADAAWWMRATAMQPSGRIDLKSKPWWPRAQQLKVGESFLLDERENTVAAAQETGNARQLVRREKVRNTSREVEAIVWVIDDDADGSILTGGDGDSDCYVVDYGGDGTVDRMVDYIDSDHDKVPDEMDIRYFEGGELRSVWVGVDLDHDGKMWDLQGYEYSHDFFKSDPYGNNMIYMNKFDPQRGEWVPISECPFAFYDTDGDGTSEVAVRISATPIDYSTASDPDYANDAGRYRGKWSDEMRRMGAVNVRYSFDIDGLSGKEHPLHYDCGFNLVGAVPYQVPGLEHFNPLRRPPQVTRVIPFDRLRQFCDTYPATETGFTWHEQHDDTIAIGAADQKDLDYRWEGVFWMWERRFMGNTGGPGQKWNVRREWSDHPASSRELYYSDVDHRIHLFGAREGWIEVGHFAGLDRLGEIRMYDTDGNGYFDRWEVYVAAGVPAGRPGELKLIRVTTVRDERARRLPFDQNQLTAMYTQEVLPRAIAANEKLLAAMQQALPFEPPAGLKAAMTRGSDTERRFAQDIAREMHYQRIRKHFTAQANEVLRQAPVDDLRKLKQEQRETGKNSATAWRLAGALEKLDLAYGEGDYDKACEALAELQVDSGKVK